MTENYQTPVSQSEHLFLAVPARWIFNTGMRRSLLFIAAVVFFARVLPAQSPEKNPIDQLIPWLLRENGDLREIPFSKVIADTTGKRVLAIDPKNGADQRVVKCISEVLDEVMKRMNAPESPVQNLARINEASSHFEDLLRELLNRAPGLRCDFPRTSEDRVQRSGYPDLRVWDTATNRIFYLDPKLYAAGSRDSSFRTFYFEPKITTNKVRDDAVHLLVGFEHEPKSAGRWTFTRWDLVDLAHFKVRLKAEFQGSNHDIYRPEAIIATSAK
ncbi:MAG: hypothetical protein DME97_08510 [Verrucomicrobia bacterium]|nr:MAG: hypothetical protein DME97_08510 [Verrucomicrobiota bacterium]